MKRNRESVIDESDSLYSDLMNILESPAKKQKTVPATTTLFPSNQAPNPLKVFSAQVIPKQNLNDPLKIVGTSYFVSSANTTPAPMPLSITTPIYIPATMRGKIHKSIPIPITAPQSVKSAQQSMPSLIQPTPVLVVEKVPERIKTKNLVFVDKIYTEKDVEIVEWLLSDELYLLGKSFIVGATLTAMYKVIENFLSTVQMHGTEDLIKQNLKPEFIRLYDATIKQGQTKKVVAYRVLHFENVKISFPCPWKFDVYWWGMPKIVDQSKIFVSRFFNQHEKLHFMTENDSNFLSNIISQNLGKLSQIANHSIGIVSPINPDLWGMCEKNTKNILSIFSKHGIPFSFASFTIRISPEYLPTSPLPVITRMINTKKFKELRIIVDGGTLTWFQSNVLPVLRFWYSIIPDNPIIVKINDNLAISTIAIMELLQNKQISVLITLPSDISLKELAQNIVLWKSTPFIKNIGLEFFPEKCMNMCQPKSLCQDCQMKSSNLNCPKLQQTQIFQCEKKMVESVKTALPENLPLHFIIQRDPNFYWIWNVEIKSKMV